MALDHAMLVPIDKNDSRVMLLWLSLALLSSNELELDSCQHGIEVKIVIRGQRICSSAYTFTFKGLHVNRNVTVLLIEFISLRLLLEVCTLYRLLILDVRRTGTKMTH